VHADPSLGRPGPASPRAVPTVDLRAVEVDDREFASWEPWSWCVEYTRRFVAAAYPAARGLRGESIKDADHHCGTDSRQLGQVLDALDDGRPVAFSGWWPTAGSVTTSTTLGVDVLDVPTPDRKGITLVAGGSVVLLGYARHDAYPGGGYFVARGSQSATGWGRGGTGCLPFTYVRAYATALWTAEPEVARPASDRASGSGAPYGTDGVDREISSKARCADPRSSYTALFFSDRHSDTLRAKAICSVCPVQRLCLHRALERKEPYGVWGGEFLDEGRIVAIKRGRGRPPRRPVPASVDEITGLPVEVAVA
jgi:WhiB family redox-sensing transcriptional regulator